VPRVVYKPKITRDQYTMNNLNHTSIYFLKRNIIILSLLILSACATTPDSAHPLLTYNQLKPSDLSARRPFISYTAIARRLVKSEATRDNMPNLNILIQGTLEDVFLESKIVSDIENGENDRDYHIKLYLNYRQKQSSLNVFFAAATLSLIPMRIEDTYSLKAKVFEGNSLRKKYQYNRSAVTFENIFLGVLSNESRSKMEANLIEQMVMNLAFDIRRDKIFANNSVK